MRCAVRARRTSSSGTGTSGCSESRIALFAILRARSPTRSRSVAIIFTAITLRRSAATGAWSASARSTAPSISTSSRSISRSARSTSRATSASRSITACTALSRIASARLPMRRRVSRSSWSTGSTARLIEAPPYSSWYPAAPSSVAPGDVVAGPLHPRIGEDLGRGPVLHQLPEVEEGGALRDARRLLHVVRHDRDRVVVAQLLDQLLDASGGDRVEGRARLVHQDHLGFHRDRPRDAQTLLLAARERRAGLSQAVLDLLPEPRAHEARLDDAVQVRAPGSEAVDAGAVGDVVVDRLREGVRLLEDHADPGPELDHVEARAEDRLAVELDLARHAAARDVVVHAVEAADQGRLPAAGGADQRRHLPEQDVEVDVPDRGRGVVVHRHAARAHLRPAGRARPLRGRGVLAPQDLGSSRRHGHRLTTASRTSDAARWPSRS